MLLLKIILSSMFLMSSLYLTNYFNSYAQISIIALSVAMIGLLLLMKVRDIKVNMPLMVLFYLFTFFGSLSSLKNSDIHSMLGVVGLLLIFVSLSKILPTFTRDNTNKFIANTILITHIPLLVISIALYPITTPYQGLFYNTNSFGSVAGTVYVVILAKMLIKLDVQDLTRKITYKKTRSFLGFSALVFVGLLVIFSGSRTSLIAITFVTIIGVAFLMVHLFRLKRLKKFIIRMSGLSIVSILIIKVIQSLIPPHMYYYILLKFQIKSGDILDGRGDVWGETFQKSNFLGNGRYFFEETGLGAHNTFISLLGQYGWATLIVFLLIILTGLFYAARYIFTCDYDSHKYLPLLMIITFSTISMGEGMMFKLSMLATFACIGAVTVKSRLQGKKIRM